MYPLSAPAAPSYQICEKQLLVNTIFIFFSYMINEMKEDTFVGNDSMIIK